MCRLDDVALNSLATQFNVQTWPVDTEKLDTTQFTETPEQNFNSIPTQSWPNSQRYWKGSLSQVIIVKLRHIKLRKRSLIGNFEKFSCCQNFSCIGKCLWTDQFEPLQLWWNIVGNVDTEPDYWTDMSNPDLFECFWIIVIVDKHCNHGGSFPNGFPTSEQFNIVNQQSLIPNWTQSLVDNPGFM